MTDSGSIEARIARLERRSRLLWLLGLAVLLVGAAAGAAAFETTVRAEKFELVSSDGTVLATLESGGEGGTGLFIRDDSARIRVSVTHSDEETALYIRDRAGDIRLGAAQFSHGGVGLALHGDSVKGAAVLYLANRKGSLRIFDQDGNVVRQIAADN